jgi:hypothetical protein
MGSEQSFLYHLRCNNLESFVWVEYEPHGKSSAAILRTLQDLIARRVLSHDAGRARVTLIGRFEGPEGKRYGHLDQFALQLRVTQVEQAKPVPERTAWPVAVASPGSSFEDDQEIRNLNSVLVFHLGGSTRYKDISSEMLADDFSFTDVGGRRADKLTFLGMAVYPFSGIIRDTEIRVYSGDNTALATGVMEKLREGAIIERQSYEIKFVRRSNGWQALSVRLTGLNPTQ